jgi:hypothetical protein
VAAMQNFIVLGIIPGTNYQTTFNFWLAIAAAFLVLMYIPKYVAVAKHMRTYLGMRQIARTIDHFELVTI